MNREACTERRARVACAKLARCVSAQSPVRRGDPVTRGVVTVTSPTGAVVTAFDDGNLPIQVFSRSSRSSYGFKYVYVECRKRKLSPDSAKKVSTPITTITIRPYPRQPYRTSYTAPSHGRRSRNDWSFSVRLRRLPDWSPVKLQGTTYHYGSSCQD